MEKNIAHQYDVFNVWFFSVLLLMNSVGVSQVVAGPDGGQVVGGTGSIAHSGTTTTINQTTQNMAIDWQSYNVNVDERVQYIQPDSSSISLNRILSQSGSTIAGRIDANGQVILVNPNGIFFTPTSMINVGGIIASGLNIQPNDFMNGNYIFDEVLGTDGAVINSGIINASLGGNVALIGRQVENDGLIVANLGSVTMAAGKQAVLTFDQDGLLGVRVSKEILQDELGVDPAVLNNGEINAEGSRVLLTASTSQDVFSQAVNTGDLNQTATSVVMHEDGSFTLGNGADVLNTGSIDTSITNNDQSLDQNIGRIVLLGENVTSSGELRADAANGHGGEIELHAQNTTLLTGNSLTSARSETNGQGGIVKVLGNRIGLFEQSMVDVSGANGGGQALIGGDFQGNNSAIRNATTTIVNGGTVIHADAIENGDGGKVILWSDSDTFFGGDIFVRGGKIGGNGGLIETSGKENLIFRGNTDRSAPQGKAGWLLLDPRDITIGTAVSDNSELDDRTVDFTDCSGGSCSSSSDDFNISAVKLQSELNAGDVVLQANRDISVTGSITTDSPEVYTLTLQAGDDIRTGTDADFSLGNDNLVMIAGSSGCDSSCQDSEGSGNTFEGGNIQLRGTIDTSGNLTLHAADSIRIDNAIGGTTAPSSIVIRAGNSIETQTNGAITSNGTITLTAADSSLTGDSLYPTVARSQPLTGNIILRHDVTTNNNDFFATTTAGYFDNWFSNRNLDAGTGAVTIQAEGAGTSTKDSNITAGAFLGDITAGSLSVTTTTGQIRQSASATRNLVVTGTSTFNAGANPINLQNTSNDLRGSIAFTTTGTNNVDLENTATTTILGDVSVGGNLTVTASQNLTLADANAGADDVVGATDSDIQLTFGTDDTGFTFTADGTVTTGTGGSITVTGGAGGDTFDINAMGLLGLDLDGAGGNDVLFAANEANFWSINGTESGGIYANTTDRSTPDNERLLFSDIESLTGGEDIDDFLVTGTGTIPGSINGGSGSGINSLTIAKDDGMPTPVPTDNTWTINAIYGGTVTAGIGTDFSNIHTITGGAGADTFQFTTTNAVVNSVTGGGGDDTIEGHHLTSTWSINGAATGGTLSNDATVSVTAPDAGVIRFTEIETLTGGDNNDIFDIRADFTGTLNGRGGNDNFNILQAVTGTVNGGTGNDTFDLSANISGIIDGDAGDDTFNINASGLTFSDIRGGDNTDTVRGPDAANTWIVNADGGGTLNGTIGFSQMETLTGGIGTEIDTFTVNTGVTIGTLNGQAGGDKFTINGNVATLNGGTGNDIIDIESNGRVTLALNGDAGTDTITVKATDTTNYGEVASISGGADADTINVNTNGRVTGVITGNDGGDNITINGTANSVDAGAGNDTLTITNASVVTGLIDGGADADSLTITGNDVTLTVGSDVEQIETLTATGSGTHTLIGSDADNTWTVNTASSLVYNSNTVNFSGFNNLTGGTGVDQFDIRVNAGTLRGGENNDTFTLRAENITATIDGGTGGSDSDTLTGFDTTTNPNTWTINSSDGGSLQNVAGTGTNVTFSEIENLTGGTDADDFTITGSGSISGTIDGGSDTGINTLTGRNADNTWEIDGTHSLGLTTSGTTYVDAFTRIDTLTGGTGIDTFNITAAFNGNINGGDNNDDFNIGADVSGTIDGGLGTDTFDVTAVTSGLLQGNNGIDTFNLGADVTGGASGGAGNDIFNISTSLSNTLSGNEGDDTFNIFQAGLTVNAIDGGSLNETTGDILAAADESNYWLINAEDGGSIYTSASNRTNMTSTALNFSDVENMVGNNGIDDFLMSSVGSVTSIDGGNDAGMNTLTGLDGANSWNITTTGNSLKITMGNNYVDVFDNIDILTGGSDVDIFTVDVGATIGTLNGQAGADVFSVTNADSVSGLIDGGDDADSLTITGSDITFVLGEGVDRVETVTAGGGSNTLTGANGGNDWDISSGGNTVTDTSTGETITFSNFSILNAGTGGDDFTVDTSGITAINGNAGTDNITLTSTGIVSTVNGGTNTDSLTISTGNNLWAVDASDDGDVRDIETLSNITTFTSIETRIGSVAGTNNIDLSAFGTDTILLAGYQNFDLLIGSGAGTLQGIDGQQNDWSIQAVAGAPAIGTAGVDDGTVSVGAVTTGFINFTNVTGGDAGDTFTIDSSGSLTGTINGGGGNNTLTGANVANTWDVTGNGSGTLGYTTTALTNTTFSGIQHLVGGSLVDTFTVNAGATIATLSGQTGNDQFTVSGTVSGVINGGSNTDDNDILNITAAGDRIIQLGTTASAGADYTVTNIETLDADGTTGNTIGNTLRGAPGDNTWVVNTDNDGTANGTIFRNFANLEGNTGIDIFTVNADISNITTGNGTNSVTVNSSGNVTGAITGGTGIDTLSIIGSAITLSTGENNDIITVSGTVSGVIDGGSNASDNDTLNITAAGDRIIQLGTTASAGADYTVTNIETLDADSTTGNIFGNTLRGATGNNTWVVNTDNDGTVNGATFRNFANLEGNTGIDTFAINAALRSINAGNGDNDITVNNAGNVTGAITGGTGIDTLDIIGSANTISTGESDDIITVSGTVGGVIDGGSNASDNDNDNDTLNITATGDQIIQLGTIASAGADYTVTNIETLDADSTTGNTLGNTLRGATGNNTWVVNADNDGTANGTTFRNFANLEGNTGIDTFAINAALRSINAGNGNNSITVNSDGNVTGAITGGTGIDTLSIIGSANTLSTGENNDIITVSGTVSGVIDGGSNASDNDTLKIIAAGDRIIQLGTIASAGADYTVTNIETLDADSTTGNTLGNTLRGATGNNTWVVNADNDGTANGTTFRNFANLEGNTGIDTFAINAVLRSINAGNGNNSITVNSDGNVTGAITGGTGIDTLSIIGSANTLSTGENNDIITVSGTVSGVIDGGINTDDNDTLNITAVGDRTVQIGTVVGSEDYTVTNVELINADGTTGNTTGNILQAGTGANVWTVSDVNDGNVGGVNFTNFANLTGNSGVDTFNVDADISGVIDGRGGADILTITSSDDQIVQLSATDLDAGENFNITRVETITVSNSATGNTLRADTGANTWVVDTDNGGDITNAGTTVNFTNFANLEGNSLVDNFSVDAQINGINAGDGVNDIIVGSTGSVTGFLITGSNDDTINIDGTVNTIAAGDGVNTISVAGSAASITSGSGNDAYNISGSASSINAGDGADTVTITATGGIRGALSTGMGNDMIDIAGIVDGVINGGAGNDDTLLISGPGDRSIELGINGNAANLNVAFIETLTANAGTVNTLVGDSDAATNDWDILGTRNGTVFDQATTTVFTNIDNVSGGATTDNFTLSTNSFTGLIHGGEGVDQLLISATGEQTVEIGNRVTGNLNVYQLETLTANGAAAKNELIADIDQIAATTNWTIDGTNIGGLADGTNNVDFINFTDLTGADGNGTDNFTISGNATSGISGLINGMGGNDRLTITATGDRVIELGDRSNTNNNVFQIETITANSSAANELISDSNSSKNSWIVNTNNGGTLSDNGVNNTTFSNFSTLSGGTTIDEFTVNSGVAINTLNGGDGNDRFIIAGTVTDAIDGGNNADTVTLNTGSNVETVLLGAGDDQFTINGGTVNSGVYGEEDNDTFVSNGGNVGLFDGGGGSNDRVRYDGTVTIALGDAVGLDGVTINNIEGVEAVDGTINARQGVITTTTWTISGDNEGQVYDTETGSDQPLSFSGFSTLNGGEGVDIFRVNGNGSVSGSVNGNGGNDTLDIDLNAASRSLSGQINFEGGLDDDMITITGTPATYTETYNPAYASGMGTYDQLAYDNGSGVTFDVNYQQTETVHDNIQTTNLTINSSGNADVISLGDNTFGTATDAVNVNYIAGSKNNMSLLALNGSDVNLTGSVTMLGDLRITADEITQGDSTTVTANSLTLDNVNQAGTSDDRLNTNVNALTVSNHSGAVFLDEQNGITLTEISSTAGNIDIAAAGSIISTADLQSGGTLTFNAADSITLGGTNTFIDTVNMTAVNDIIFTGDIVTSSAVTLAAGNNINLSSINNQLSSGLTLSGSTVDINNTVATALTNVTAQNLTITSTGSIMGTGAIIVQGSGETEGVTNLTSITGSIVLDNENNNFENVSLTAANDVTLIESDGITLTTVDITDGALSVTANNGLASNDAAIGEMILGNINATTINLNAREGAIVSEASNLLADTITLAAASGIGIGGGIGGSAGAINTTTSTLSVINASFDGADTPSEAGNVNTLATSGTININNRGNVTINDLRNTGNASLDDPNNDGDITLTNTGNITLAITGGSGAIDANYGSNINNSRYAGDVTIVSTEGGTFSTLGTGTSGNADIIAESLYVDGVSGFGTRDSPIGLRVNENFRLLARPGAQAAIYYLGAEPRNIFTSDDLALLVVRGFIGLSSQQLIEIETLGEIDQAIFTEVRNYNHDDVAILLPADQRYGDSDDDEEEKEKDSEDK